MQGQRSTLDSFSETFGLDHGSSTSDTGVDQQLYWNDMLNPVESGFPGFLLPPGETNSTNMNSVSCDGRSSSGWNLGEPSSGESTRNQIIHDEPRTEHGLSSSSGNHAESDPRLEERLHEASNTLFPRHINIDLNRDQEANVSLFSHPSSSNGIRHNLNLNTEYTNDIGNDGHFIETGISHMYKPGGSETAHINLAGGSATPFGTVSGSAGYLADETDGRPGCSLDGRRLSCKRKTLEGVSGQSSLGGSPSYFPRAEDSVWHAFPARYNASSSSSTSTSAENPLAPNLPEQLNPPPGIVFRGVASDRHPAFSVSGHAESSQRNFRMRINPSQQQDLSPSSLALTGNAVRHPHVWPAHQLSSRHIPLSHSLDSRPSAADTSSQSQSHITHIHGLPRNIPPFQYHGAPNSRAAGSSSSIIPGERPVLREEMHSRSRPRNISAHPLFVPASDTRSLAQNPTDWSLANGNTSTPGNFASASRVGSSSGVYPSQPPTWVPPPNVTTQYSRRLSEVVRRTLYPSAGSESGVQNSNFPPLHSGPPIPSQDMVLSSAAGSQGNHQPHPRSAFLLDRQGDGVPLSFRSLAAASGRRSRLLSEIRNVLDIVRRGGDGLRFEDVLILDQSVFFGVADLHDRHRDMRLDVDNMSYEELLALEERIGNVNTGLNEETISKRLKQRKYFTVRVNSASEIEPCCVCQEEYIDGEDLGTLDCGHDFHSECIKQWLTHKNICPICKTTALVT